MKEQLNIISPKEISEIHIFDIMGKEVYTINGIYQKKFQINTAFINSGFYSIKILNGGGSDTYSFIKAN